MKLRYLFLLCATLGANAVLAQESTSPTPTEKALNDLKHEITVRDQVIRNLIQRIEKLEAAVSGGQKPETVVAKAESTPTSQSASAQIDAQSQDAERIRAAFERTLIDRGGLVLPKGSWEIDA